MERKDVERELKEARAAGRRPNFASKDLSFANLSGLDFSGADLSRANLKEANLDGCLFVRADLYFANCKGASCVEADFSHAKLNRASFKFATLLKADFRGVNFFSTDLNGVDWEGAILEGGPLGFSVVYSTTDGWMVQVSNWIGTPQQLEEAIAGGSFSKLCGLSCEDSISYMRAFSAFIQAHIKASSGTIEDLSKW